ncbi:MAG: hypothetical protein LBG48_04575 [Rickettsiales bacterium]|jgi:hypothetical protein|nr:hypothetical protein [Rickettsiales bacterium]
MTIEVLTGAFMDDATTVFVGCYPDDWKCEPDGGYGSCGPGPAGCWPAQCTPDRDTCNPGSCDPNYCNPKT